MVKDKFQIAIESITKQIEDEAVENLNSMSIEKRWGYLTDRIMKLQYSKLSPKKSAIVDYMLAGCEDLIERTEKEIRIK